MESGDLIRIVKIMIQNGFEQVGIAGQRFGGKKLKKSKDINCQWMLSIEVLPE